MAEITNKRCGELLQGLFRILEKESDGMKARDALAALEHEVPPTGFETESYKSGGRRFENNDGAMRS